MRLLLFIMCSSFMLVSATTQDNCKRPPLPNPRINRYNGPFIVLDSPLQLISINDSICKMGAASMIEEKIPALYEFQQKRMNQLLDQPRRNWTSFIILHTKIDTDSDGYRISIEQSDAPFDLCYVDKKGTIKIVIATADGNISWFDNCFSTSYVGGARIINKTVRRILKSSPECIFVCDAIPYSFLTIKDEEIFIYDFFRTKPQKLSNYLKST